MHQLWSCPTDFSTAGCLFVWLHPRGGEPSNVRRGDIHLWNETIALSVVGWRWRLLPEAGTDSSADGGGRVADYKAWNWSCVSAAARRGAAQQHCTQPSPPITELLPSAKMSNGAAAAAAKSDAKCSLTSIGHCGGKINWCLWVRLLQCPKSHIGPIHLCQGSDNTYVKMSFLSLFLCGLTRYWEEILSNQGCAKLWSIYVQKWCYALFLFSSQPSSFNYLVGQLYTDNITWTVSIVYRLTFEIV